MAWELDVDTGGATNTGGRLKRLAPVLGRETLMATYGDGMSNVDINALVAFHRQNGKLATTTAHRGRAPAWCLAGRNLGRAH